MVSSGGQVMQLPIFWTSEEILDRMSSRSKYETIHLVPLGAGREVGRSCILLSMGGKNIILDCGIHMGYSDDRRFPDFSYLTKSGDLNGQIDCIIISHFHLDHCGALPYVTGILERKKING